MADTLAIAADYPAEIGEGSFDPANMPSGYVLATDGKTAVRDPNLDPLDAQISGAPSADEDDWLSDFSATQAKLNDPAYRVHTDFGGQETGDAYVLDQTPEALDPFDPSTWAAHDAEVATLPGDDIVRSDEQLDDQQREFSYEPGGPEMQQPVAQEPAPDQPEPEQPVELSEIMGTRTAPVQANTQAIENFFYGGSGVLDALNQTLLISDEIIQLFEQSAVGRWLQDVGLGNTYLHVDGDGVRFVYGRPENAEILQLPTYEKENAGMVPGFSRAITHFVASMAVIRTGIPGGGAGIRSLQGFGRELAASAGAAFTFDPTEGGLVSMLKELGVESDFLAYLDAQVPEGSDAAKMLEGRLMLAFEEVALGGSLGLAFMSALRGLKAMPRNAADVQRQLISAGVAPKRIGETLSSASSYLESRGAEAMQRLQSGSTMHTAGGVITDAALAGAGKLASVLKSGSDAVDVARADVRQGSNVVAERLNILVPPHSRVAGGDYKVGQPDGKPWSALTDDELATPGPGYKGTDQDIDRMWSEAVQESSQAAQTAAEATGARVTMRSDDWDQALRLPLRSQLWYELSGESFQRRLPVLAEDNDLLITFNDLIGVTSPREKPLDNLRRSLALLSQHLRGVPIDVDLTNPSGVQEAFARAGSGSAIAAGNKTGNFADTLSLVAGADVPPPIPVNDIWVGRIFDVTDEQLMQYQSLHEPMAIFWNKMRDHVNNTAPGKFPHESWQLQARGWVSLRGAQDDYAQGLDVVVQQLQDAGIPGITKNGVITREALEHPDFVDTLRPTVPPFRDAPKATIEFGTTQTAEGARAAEAVAELRKQTDNPKAANLVAKYNTILTSEMHRSARGKMNMWDQAYAHVMGITSKSKADVSRIRYPRSDRPFDVAGTFEGVFSPNIRVPLRGMTDDQVALFNSIVGTGLRQDAMAASRIKILDVGEKAAEGTTLGRTVFIKSAADIDGSVLEQFVKLLPEGFDVSTDRVANGYIIDINPRFTDDGPVGAVDDDIYKAVDGLESGGYNAKILDHQHSSVYNESGEYASRLNNRKQELTDAFYGELRDKFGWSEVRSRRFLDGRGMGKASANVKQRAKRIRAAYKGRLSTLDGAVAAAREASDRVRTRHRSWLTEYDKYRAARGDEELIPPPDPLNNMTTEPAPEAGFLMEDARGD